MARFFPPSSTAFIASHNATQGKGKGRDKVALVAAAVVAAAVVAAAVVAVVVVVVLVVVVSVKMRRS